MGGVRARKRDRPWVIIIVNSCQTLPFTANVIHRRIPTLIWRATTPNTFREGQLLQVVRTQIEMYAKKVVGTKG